MANRLHEAAAGAESAVRTAIPPAEESSAHRPVWSRPAEKSHFHTLAPQRIHMGPRHRSTRLEHQARSFSVRVWSHTGTESDHLREARKALRSCQVEL